MSSEFKVAPGGKFLYRIGEYSIHVNDAPVLDSRKQWAFLNTTSESFEEFYSELRGYSGDPSKKNLFAASLIDELLYLVRDVRDHKTALGQLRKMRILYRIAAQERNL